MKRKPIDAHDKLDSILLRLMAEAHTTALLPRGLRLTWDCDSDSQATFTMTRLGTVPSDQEIAIVRAAGGGVLEINQDQQQQHSETLVNASGKEYTWTGYAWQLKVETIRF